MDCEFNPVRRLSHANAHDKKSIAVTVRQQLIEI